MIRTRTSPFRRLILFFLIAIQSPHIVAGELGNCAEPLLFRDGVENPFDCNDSPTSNTSPEELRALLGEQEPVEFCIPESGLEGGLIVCTGSCNGGTGCPGTFSTPELTVNATGEQLCGSYTMQVSQIDVEALGIGVLCEATFDAIADVIMTVDSTYTGPLTWVIDSGQPEILNFQSKLGGTCGGVADNLLPFFEGTLISLLEGALSDLLGGLSNLGVCPVDSLHPDLILP